MKKKSFYTYTIEVPAGEETWFEEIIKEHNYDHAPVRITTIDVTDVTCFKSDRELYDYHSVYLRRNKKGEIKEVHLQYPGSKLCHHTITAEGDCLIFDPPAVPDKEDE